MSAVGERGAATRAEECRRTARALAPRARHDGGLSLSGSAAAALAELFRALSRDGVDLADITDVAERAARRVRADAEAAGQVDAERGGTGTTTVTTPSPRAPADHASGALAAR